MIRDNWSDAFWIESAQRSSRKVGPPRVSNSDQLSAATWRGTTNSMATLTSASRPEVSVNMLLGYFTGSVSTGRNAMTGR